MAEAPSTAILDAARRARGRLRRRTSYGAYRAYRLARLRWRRRPVDRWNPVLVYQMGKVGSTAVTHGLRSSSLPRSVVHVHNLNPRSIQEIDDFGRAEYARTGTISPVVLDAIFLAPRLADMARRHPLDIVTLVREPVGRNLSGFFESLPARHPEVAARIRTDDPDDASLLLARTTFVDDALRHDPFSWFDEELRPVTGLDVFAEPFDPAQGYAIYENERCRVLLLRFDDLAAVFGPAVERFFGVSDVSLPRHNDARDRDTAAAYQHLAGNLRLPTEDLHSIFGSERVRHFYSGEEIDRLIARWSA